MSFKKLKNFKKLVISFVLPIAIALIAIIFLIIAIDEIRYGILSFDKGISEPDNTPTQNKDSDLLFSEVEINSAQTLVNTPIELRGWVSNATTNTLYLNLGLTVKDTSKVEARNGSNELDRFGKALHVRSDNSKNIILSPNEKRSFQIVFELKVPFAQALEIGVAAVGKDAAQNPVFRQIALTNQFIVLEPQAWQLIWWYAKQIPTFLCLFVAITLIATLVAWKCPPFRRQLVYWKILLPSRTATIKFYLVTGLTIAIIMGVIFIPLSNTTEFSTLVTKADKLIVLWMVLPIVIGAAYAWWSKNLLITLLIISLVYLQLHLRLTSQLETIMLVSPVLSLVLASFAASISFYLLRVKKWRSILGIYLLMCSLILVVGSSSVFISY